MYNDETKARVKSRLVALLGALEALGVTHVYAEYDGTGDEGDIRVLECRAGDTTVVDIPDQVFDDVHEACRALLFAELGVWYDGDGGAGNMVIATATASVTLNHGWYETVLNDDSKSFNLRCEVPDDAEGA